MFGTNMGCNQNIVKEFKIMRTKNCEPHEKVNHQCL